VTTATITAEELARLLGVALWTLYQSVSEGTCPIEPLRVGRRMVWPSAPVAALLGVESLDDVKQELTSVEGDASLRLEEPT